MDLINMDLSTFDEVYSFLDEYSSLLFSESESDYVSILFAEAKKRIRQLRRLLMIVIQLSERVHALQPQLTALPPYEGPDPRSIFVEWSEACESIEMYTEVFYYIAWRLRCVIRRLPKLNSFDPRGVRFIRNHMIEHPEKHGQDVLYAFHIDRDLGPVLLRASVPDGKILDKGLWQNATEFIDKLKKKLEMNITVP